MKAVYALLFMSHFVTAIWAAPAPQPRENRYIVHPQKILERLRAEGFDVTGLKHEGGERWILEHVTAWTAPMRIIVVRRVIVVAGDPTAKLREVLLVLQPR